MGAEIFAVVEREGQIARLHFTCTVCDTPVSVDATPRGRDFAKFELCQSCMDKCTRESPYDDARFVVYGEPAEHENQATRKGVRTDNAPIGGTNARHEY